MPHSDHHHPTSKHCHHGRKQHHPRDKKRDQPDGWSGKAEKGNKDVVQPPKPVQIPAIRLWSKWLPGDEERSWFWQARQRENGAQPANHGHVPLIADKEAGKWEYQFTKDFSTIYQEERPKVQQPIPYRMPIPPVSTVPAINPYPKLTQATASAPISHQAPAPGPANVPRIPAAEVMNAETVVSSSSMDASTVEQQPPPNAGTPKPRKEQKHSHQKPHKSSKKIGSVVKADKKVKFDSQSIVENWQVEWPAET